MPNGRGSGKPQKQQRQLRSARALLGEEGVERQIEALERLGLKPKPTLDDFLPFDRQMERLEARLAKFETQGDR